MEPKTKPTRKNNKMTICFSALAEESDAIVCIADKCISYGDFIAWDTECSKIIQIEQKNMAVLTAGNDDVIFRVLRRIVGVKNIGENLNDTIRVCEDIYNECAEEIRINKHLKPLLLKREEFVNAITNTEINPQMKFLAEEIVKPLGFEFILCGFDNLQKPFILTLDNSGVITECTNNGFSAIGSGTFSTLSRFAWSESSRKHPVERVLYDCFDAKVNAELVPGVGYEWDAKILIKNKQAHEVNDDIKELIDNIWKYYNVNPFEIKTERKKIGLTRTWKEKLEEFGNKIFPDRPSLKNLSKKT